MPELGVHGGYVVLPGEKLRLALVVRGKTQEEFARLCGVSTATVSRACNSKAIQTRTFLKMWKLLEALPVLVSSKPFVALESHVEAERAESPKFTKTPE